MAKKIDGYIKLNIPAGAANPSPPVGPALGQRGVNIMEFCKAFNAETQQMEQGAPLPVVITVYQDKTFSFVFKKPPASYLIMKAINIKKASQTPGRDEPIAKISRKQWGNLRKGIGAPQDNLRKNLDNQQSVTNPEFYV